MQNLIQQLTLSQFEAALCTLNVCLIRCPDALWGERIASFTLNQAALHALIFADLYLGPSDDEEAIKRQPFHIENAAWFRDYEEFADRPQVHAYDKSFLLDYVQFCRQKAIDVISNESLDTLAGPSGFTRRKCSRAELHVYNTRHVQHHAAHISLRLRLNAGIDIPWISHGWREV